ncbi:TetR/AcrR family transcriptional regulator [Novosphingobium sp. BL-8H]|uniref:TetR/AcrR family transcriptional regulator n=1 Tax=Novosphingobium sp. BL-8H TaxID=3127640 RepID=UPI0037582BD6
MNPTSLALSPRKTPHQARAQATIEILHTAAIQLLIREGLLRCTTTRIAERAGMSVGSLYQYYPNRDALLAAVLENHLTALAEGVEALCRDQQGGRIARMAASLAKTFLALKLDNPGTSQALYAIAGERGGAELVERLSKRMIAAIATMLKSASDARIDDPLAVATVVLSTMAGNVRAVLDGHAPPGFEGALREQLVLLLSSYLQAIGSRAQSEPQTPTVNSDCASTQCEGEEIMETRAGDAMPCLPSA